jgi:hypothetical protein
VGSSGEPGSCFSRQAEIRETENQNFSLRLSVDAGTERHRSSVVDTDLSFEGGLTGSAETNANWPINTHPAKEPSVKIAVAKTTSQLWSNKPTVKAHGSVMPVIFGRLAAFQCVTTESLCAQNHAAP